MSSVVILYSMNRVILIVFCWLICLAPCLADDTKEDKVFISTSKSRSLAMGGAYTGVSHKTESLLWNPAGVELPVKRNVEGGRAYLNLFAAPFVAAEVLSGLFGIFLSDGGLWFGEEQENEPDFPDPEPLLSDPKYYPEHEKEDNNNMSISAMPFFIKSMLFGDQKLAIVINLAEDVLPHPTLESGLKNADPNEEIYDNKSYHIGIKYKATESLSVGTNLSYYHLFENNKHDRVASYTLGLMHQPMQNLSLGLTYVNEKPSALEPLGKMERIINETCNFGASFKPDNQTEIACDIRNLTDSDKPAYREFHYGIERQLVRWLWVQGGYYKERDTDDDVFSCGLRYRSFNYTFVKNTSQDFRYHLIGITMTVKF